MKLKTLAYASPASRTIRPRVEHISMFGSLTLTALSGAPTIRADHDLVAVIAAAIEHSDVEFPGNDVLILMQKIV
jgi:hypothetical protein